MLPFQQAAISELFDEDGLLVCAPGLCMEVHILSSLCALRAELQRQNVAAQTILVLNCDKTLQARVLAGAEEALPSPASSHCPRRIDSNVTLAERSVWYRSGGVFMISSRIAVVDLLSGRCAPHIIAGVFIFHAERVRDDSVESFIARIYRRGSRTGFLKAFCEQPGAISKKGGHAVTDILSLLSLKRLYLWPRFRAEVSDTLAPQEPGACVDVVELGVPPSPFMQAIGDSIRTLVQMCVQEVVQANNLIDRFSPILARLKGANGGDDRQLKLVFDSVKEMKKLLDSLGGRIGPKTKQLLADINALKGLCIELAEGDCVSFMDALDTVVRARVADPAAAALHSAWLFTREAEILINSTRERVFGEVVQEQLDKEPVDRPGITSKELLLEPNPKWKVLLDVLKEIEEEEQKNIALTEPGCVLIVCTEFRSYVQVESLLQEGSRSYLLRALVKQREATKKRDAEEQNQQTPGLKPVNVVAGGKKRKTKTGFGGKGHVLDREAWMRALTETPEKAVKLFATMPASTATNAPGAESVIQKEYDTTFGVVEPSFVAVRLISPGGSSERGRIILEALRPRYIVLYQPNLSFVRQIEVFKARNIAYPMRVYSLTATDTVEEASFQRLITKERDAFATLIDTKCTMLPSITSMDFTTTAATTSTSASSVPASLPATCRDGSESSTKLMPVISPQPPLIHSGGMVLVDLREFRSSLPSMIDKCGMQVRPTHLIVADYILSRDIGVERKSLADLFGSFASGRLFSQAEALCTKFAIPILLIEWVESQNFLLPADQARQYGLTTREIEQQRLTGGGNKRDTSGDVSERDVRSKLVVLMHHFPRLRILWSRTPTMSAELFKQLKEGRADPDPNEFLEEQSADAAPVVDSTSTTEVLLHIPGFTERNMMPFINSLPDGMPMAELARMDKASLTQRLGGNEVAASYILKFLSFSCPP